MLDDQINTHPAGTAVFETNELLRQIVLSVPMESFVSLLRVSKTWNSVAHNIGYFIKPGQIFRGFLSVYPEHVRLDFNPVLYMYDGCPKGTSWDRHPWRLWRVSFGVHCKYNSPVLDRFGHQFLTSPPVTKISLGLGGGDAHAMLRVHDGIRLRDLAEAFRKLGAAADVECSPERCCQAHILDIQFYCTRGRFGDHVQRREQRMRMELEGWEKTYGQAAKNRGT
jgi:hypothetical protein